MSRKVECSCGKLVFLEPASGQNGRWIGRCPKCGLLLELIARTGVL